MGARSFWIHNTGPIGCLPYILANFLSAQRDSHGCPKPYNDVAKYFNYKLKEAIVQLRIDLPLAAITYVDLYSAKYSLFSEPKKHGKRAVPCESRALKIDVKNARKNFEVNNFGLKICRI